jgi:starch phosphorylase
MEFMLSEALPIYSGGLGNVAGDQLKAASDLGVPVVGVGLLYQQGYFRQVIDKDGAQQALYPYNDPGQLPITPLRKANGEWLRLEIALPGYSVWLRAWQVQVGRVKLYLLDSNDAANFPLIEGSPANFMAADRNCASNRSCSSGSADGGCSLPWEFNRKSVI